MADTEEELIFHTKCSDVANSVSTASVSVSHFVIGMHNDYARWFSHDQTGLFTASIDFNRVRVAIFELRRVSLGSTRTPRTGRDDPNGVCV